MRTFSVRTAAVVLLAVAGLLAFQTVTRGEDDSAHSDHNKMNHLASRIIGMDVTDTSGTSIGRIKDIVLKPGEGKIAYVAVAMGGHMGMGGRWVAVPLNQLTFADHRALLSVSADQAKNMKGFDQWPRSADARWAQEATEGPQPANGEVIPKEALWACRVSRLIGQRVVDRESKPVGDIEDMVVCPREDSVRWAVVSYGGTLGVGSSYAAVPVSALVVEAHPREVRFSGDLAKLGAARIDGDDTARFANDAGQQNRVEAQFPRGAAPMTLVPDYKLLAGHGVDEGDWAAESAYNRMYDRKTEATINGRVEGVGVYYPNADNRASEGLRFRVRTADGKTLTVHAGPRFYTDQKGLDIRNDDTVTVIGSRVDMHGRTVLLARQVSLDGKTYDLRDQDGKPRWSVPAKIGPAAFTGQPAMP